MRHKLARTAAMLCNNPRFQAYLGVSCPERAARHIRTVCGITSRRELDRNPEAAKKFHEIRRGFAYQGDA